MNVLEGIISEERRYGSMPYIETGTNHQIFSDIVDAYGLSGFQNGAWCATYQFAMELIMCGKETALSHWCMESDYVGYNVFATRNAFRAKGRTGSSPRLGSLVIFKRSHMGRVLSINGDTFQCGEGNTSNSEFDRDGDSCAVKSYSVTDPGIDCFCYIDYGDDKMTPTKLIKATAAVYQMAHNEKFRYGDSKTLPPCEDHLISCDRLIARALWNLGYRDQPKGGITVLNMEQYLPKYGTTKIMREEDIKAGDIVVMKQNGTSAPTDKWHTFLLTDFQKQTNCSKYDFGNANRWAPGQVQPFTHVKLNEWPDKSFYCAFRLGLGDTSYTFTTTTCKKGSKSNSAYLATEILKARGYKGVKDASGNLKDLALDFDWSKGDMAATARYKWDRIVNGKNLCSGPYGAGEIGPSDWVDLMGGGIPFTALELPTKQRKGTSVLLAQEILRAREMKGADGQPLELDSEWGENTEHAVKQYQKARKLPVTGKVTADVWYDMIGL